MSRKQPFKTMRHAAPNEPASSENSPRTVRGQVKILHDGMCQRSYASMDAAVLKECQNGSVYQIHMILDKGLRVWVKVVDGFWILAKEGKFIFCSIELEGADGILATYEFD